MFDSAHLRCPGSLAYTEVGGKTCHAAGAHRPAGAAPNMTDGPTILRMHARFSTLCSHVIVWFTCEWGSPNSGPREAGSAPSNQPSAKRGHSVPEQIVHTIKVL